MATLRSAAPGGDELDAWLENGYPAAYRTAWLILHNHADAEEAVQEAFLRLWRFRDAIPADADPKRWLYRVVVNACLSRLRAERSRGGRVWEELDAERPAASATDPPASAVAGEARRAVLGALRSLPERLRVVVVLRYYAQLDEKEIAEVIHRRPGTVKSRLHEARGRLGADPSLAGFAELVEGPAK